MISETDAPVIDLPPMPNCSLCEIDEWIVLPGMPDFISDFIAVIPRAGEPEFSDAIKGTHGNNQYFQAHIKGISGFHKGIVTVLGTP